MPVMFMPKFCHQYKSFSYLHVKKVEKSLYIPSNLYYNS